MALLCDELVVATPGGERQHGFGGGGLVQEQCHQQRTDLRDCQRDQGLEAFFRLSGLGA